MAKARSRQPSSLLDAASIPLAVKRDFASAAADWLKWNERWPLEGGFLEVECVGGDGAVPRTVLGLGPDGSLLVLDDPDTLVELASSLPEGSSSTVPHGEVVIGAREEFGDPKWQRLSREELTLPGDLVCDFLATDHQQNLRSLAMEDARRAICAVRAATSWVIRDALEQDLEELIVPLAVAGTLSRFRIQPLGQDALVPGTSSLGLEREPEGTTYQLHIAIQDSSPLIWRRVRVAGSVTLAGLHHILQRVMGWDDCHLHQFEIGDRMFTPPYEDFEGYHTPPENENAVRLDQVASVGELITYTYDFGDDWVHTILIESVERSTDEEPIVHCTGGAQACPPEDSGGIHGYYDLLAQARGRSRAAREAREWLGEHDPNHFHLPTTNAYLADLAEPGGAP